MRWPGSRIALATLIVAAVVFGGCGLFSIRDPMTPIVSPTEHIANDPDSVIANFRLGIETERGGFFILTNALADSFQFQLDPSDAQNSYGMSDVRLSRSETVDGWRSFISGTLRNEEFRIVFGPPSREDVITPGVLIEWYDVPYELVTTTIAEGDTVTKAVIAEGEIDILSFTEKGGGNWAILKWVDTLTGSVPTIGSRIETGSGHPR